MKTGTQDSTQSFYTQRGIRGIERAREREREAMRPGKGGGSTWASFAEMYDWRGGVQRVDASGCKEINRQLQVTVRIPVQPLPGRVRAVLHSVVRYGVSPDHEDGSHGG